MRVREFSPQRGSPTGNFLSMFLSLSLVCSSAVFFFVYRKVFRHFPNFPHRLPIIASCKRFYGIDLVKMHYLILAVIYGVLEAA